MVISPRPMNHGARKKIAALLSPRAAGLLDAEAPFGRRRRLSSLTTDMSHPLRAGREYGRGCGRARWDIGHGRFPVMDVDGPGRVRRPAPSNAGGVRMSSGSASSGLWAGRRTL